MKRNRRGSPRSSPLQERHGRKAGGDAGEVGKETGRRERCKRRKPSARKRPPTLKQLAERAERRRKQKTRWAKKVRELRAIEKRKAAQAVSKEERAAKARLKEERRQERYWQWRLGHHKQVVAEEKAKSFQEGYQLGLEVGRGQSSSVQGCDATRRSR